MKYGKNKRSVTDARDAMLEKEQQAKNYKKEAKQAQQVGPQNDVYTREIYK